MRIDDYFFDFDGTLAQTAEDLAQTWRQVLARLGKTCDDEKKLYHVGPLLTDWADELLPGLAPEKKQEMMTMFRQIYVADGYPFTVPYPGIVDWLTDLKNAGKRLFLATNKFMIPTQTLLRKTGLSGFFEGIYTPDAFHGRMMLKKEFLAVALRERNCDPEHSMMVGDSLGDLLAGRTNGMKVGMVEWGYGCRGEIEANHPDCWFKLNAGTGVVEPLFPDPKINFEA